MTFACTLKVKTFFIIVTIEKILFHAMTMTAIKSFHSMTMIAIKSFYAITMIAIK